MPLPRNPARRRIERETTTLALPGGAETQLLRVRDPRARRLRLMVDERGARLTLPRAASERDADAFLDQHRDWLMLQLRERIQAQAAIVPFGRGHAGPLPLRGGSVGIVWSSGRFARAELIDGNLAIQLPERATDATARRVLHDFYLAQARADVGRWLPGYLPGLPAAPSAIRIRPLASIWGSLAPGNAVSLDLALVLAPPAAFEYVLVHELCHLLQRNHSTKFWREVEARCADWRGHRQWFRDNGALLKSTLRGLLARTGPG
ncbi:MAG: SprT family zinc-dependent metalloprotease [Xanthomonadaceae bacterium]|nr:SprT family zinc-dependent metalloprotease [Xanthomonadaceae bacterium]